MTFGKLDIQIITVTSWLHFVNIGRSKIEVPLDRIHNTKFYSISARNEIFQTCDTIKASFEDKHILKIHIHLLLKVLP